MTVSDLSLDFDSLFQHGVDRVARLLLMIETFPQDRGVDLLAARVVTCLQDLLHGCGDTGHGDAGIRETATESLFHRQTLRRSCRNSPISREELRDGSFSSG